MQRGSRGAGSAGLPPSGSHLLAQSRSLRSTKAPACPRASIRFGRRLAGRPPLVAWSFTSGAPLGAVSVRRREATARASKSRVSEESAMLAPAALDDLRASVRGGGHSVAGKSGLADDDLIAAGVVTAAGDILRASPADDHDLFCRLRGGGGLVVPQWLDPEEGQGARGPSTAHGR